MTAVYVQMGTTSAIECHPDPSGESDFLVQPLEGERIFEIGFADEPLTLRELVSTTMATFRKHQLVGHDDQARLVPPLWVRSNSQQVQDELVAEYKLGKNDIPAGYGTEHEAWSRLSFPALRVLTATQMMFMVPAAVATVLALYSLTRLHLRTTAGRDYQANLMANPASNGTGAYAPASYIALTADNTAPAAGDTSLPGEIVSGTLIRALGAFAHTTGAASYTLSKLFTSDQSVTIAKIGLFNAATGGSPFIETLLSPATILNSGDQLQIVSTVTL